MRMRNMSLCARAVAVAVSRLEVRGYVYTAQGEKSLRSENFGAIDKILTRL